MNAPFDVTGIRIETERLILRPWRESDLADFYEYASVDGVGQMAGWQPHQSMDESRRTLSAFIAEKKTFALVWKDNCKAIGSISLNTYQPDGLLDFAEHLNGRVIGYVLCRDYWGRGVMPEAVKAVCDYCFRKLDFDWLACTHFVWNQRSQRVIEKCGFQFVEEILHRTLMGKEEPSRFYILYNPNK